MPDPALLFTELGLIVLALAILARVALRFGLTPIPLYLLAGLAAGEGGIISLELSEDFVHLGSEIGIVLLLLTLGLEYTADELAENLRTGFGAGFFDIAANFTPGLAAGLLLGWDPVAAFLLGGVTYISSSGVVAKVLADLGRLGNRETPTLLSLLVFEDLVMALYLPIVAVLLAGTGLLAAIPSVIAAVSVLGAVVLIALRHGGALSRLVSSQSDEALLLTVLGATLLVAGIAQQLQVSAAVGAFLTGVALSSPLSERAAEVISPLRDLFAAMFFLFFGLEVDPGQIPPVAAVAGALAVVTALTKVATGWWAAARAGIGGPGRVRAGITLIPRGEFSIVIAGLGVTAGLEAELGAVSAAYVTVLAVAGPILAKLADPIGERLLGARAKPGA